MDYREQTAEGRVKSWRRAYSVQIVNAHGQIPRIIFHEEDRTALPDGRSMVTNNTSCEDTFTDPNAEFPIIHHETGEKLGTATHGTVYTLLFSLYMATASKRDNRETETT